MPFLAGSRLGDGRRIKPVVWLSALGAMVGVGFLENGGGSPAGIGDVWSLLSAVRRCLADLKCRVLVSTRDKFLMQPCTSG